VPDDEQIQELISSDEVLSKIRK